MTDDVEPILVPVPVRPRRLPEIDEFQRIEGLPSRADALALLLEIALDAITSPGRRFWDRPGAAPRRTVPAQVYETIYSSPNGDTWLLGRDAASGKMVVRHEPNPSSGGQASERGLDAFLMMDGAGPEFTALRAMLTGKIGDR
jgi:hypothetical protein